MCVHWELKTSNAYQCFYIHQLAINNIEFEHETSKNNNKNNIFMWKMKNRLKTTHIFSHLNVSPFLVPPHHHQPPPPIYRFFFRYQLLPRAYIVCMPLPVVQRITLWIQRSAFVNLKFHKLLVLVATAARPFFSV